MIYESLKSFQVDHPRYFRALSDQWKAGIKSVTYDKTDRSLRFETHSLKDLDMLNASRPARIKARITLFFDNSVAVNDAYETRMRRQGRDPKTGEYVGLN